MTPYTESARTVLSALKALSIPEDKRALIERGVTELDQELHEYHTAAPQTLSADDAILSDDVGDTLPKIYAPELLSPQQRRIIALLVKAGSHGMTRGALFLRAFGRHMDDCDADRRTEPSKQLDVQMTRCRRVLEHIRPRLLKAGLPSFINCVQGQGFRLDKEQAVRGSEAKRRAQYRYDLTVTQQRVFDHLSARPNKWVHEDKLIEVAQFMPWIKTKPHELLRRNMSDIRLRRSVEIEKNAKHEYRLVKNG